MWASAPGFSRCYTVVMNVNGKPYRTIWPLGENTPGAVAVIDQRRLPHEFLTLELHSVADYCHAISDMAVRGAGLIGATAAWGMCAAAYSAAAEKSSFDEAIALAAAELKATRPTAVNLAWAVGEQEEAIAKALSGPAPGGTGLEADESPVSRACVAARQRAIEIADSDAAMCRSIGVHGLEIIRKIRAEKDAAGRGNEPVNILTHCNAGWLAFVDHGSATAPVYAAHDEGLAVHVWVDETRPRAQGAALTAWELGSHGVSHDVVADNAGGHMMQHGLVDMVITGADRVSAGGDAANKIGTYLKALAASDNNIPFYVALPSSTFDWNIDDGVAEIPIEERHGDEVRFARGLSKRSGSPDEVLICPENSSARNWGFDVTPRRLITALITERGICPASREGISGLFPERH